MPSVNAIIRGSAAIALSLSIAFAATAAAFTVRPTSVTILGRGAAGSHFWKPSAAIAINNAVGALKILTSSHICEYMGNCDFRVAYTLDGGDSFQVSKDPHKHFCGAGGVVRGGKLYCPGGSIEKDGDDEVLTYEEVEFTIDEKGVQSTTPKKARMTFESRKPFKTMPITGLKFGEKTLALDDRSTHIRNVEATLKNGTKVHGVYKSADAGKTWQWVSHAPIAFGPYNTLMRLGDTKLMLVSGPAAGYLNSTQSVYLGTRWDEVKRSPFHMLPEVFLSPYNVAVYTGIRGRPGIHMYATSAKKGSERPIDVTDFHNRIVTKKAIADATNYTQDFISTPNFDCLDPDTYHPRKDIVDHDAAGCSSSSYLTTMSFENNSFIAFYDQLQNGYHPSVDHDDHTIYAMKLAVNDTKEKEEYEEKLDEERRKKEQEKEYDLQREQLRKERQEKKRREKRDKQRKNLEKRKAFDERDKPFLEEAERYFSRTGDWVVVRDVDPEWSDFERTIV